MGPHSLVVADTQNSCLREIDIERGMVRTLCGAPRESGSADGRGAEARMRWPTACCKIDATRLSVVDKHRVIAVSVGGDLDGEALTLAGTAVPGGRDGECATSRFWEPAGVVALRKCGGTPNLVVADSGNHRLRIIHLPW